MTKHVSRNDDEARLGTEATEGFTLVELLVVLAIIGLIAALVAPQVLKYLGSAKVDTTKAQIKNIENALELYYIDVGHYPSTEEGLEALARAPADGSAWNGPYLKKSGTFLDAWGTAYEYKSPADEKPYQIISLGRDRKVGGDGQDADLSSE
ncbi:type II secretion system protein GspG [Rhizobium chutanense]|uniref:Type II secretion system core protein G n=1 Tax=Rhizobium chutanense TaxID=2035448 RepID=A0A2A6J2C1_9HYPH|nr:type II secretion system major pseudopilin GspG [Rhizobium chutanense]PDT00060.1 type II secretion system protein GspG [Rhizobium chutanense]